MKTELTNKNGEISYYALCCGYTMKKGSTILSMEHHVYHVRRPGSWLTFDRLAEARKHFKAQTI